MKFLKNLLMGIPIKGEPINFTNKVHTTMPPNVKITYQEWYDGSWINNL